MPFLVIWGAAAAACWAVYVFIWSDRLVAFGFNSSGPVPGLMAPLLAALLACGPALLGWLGWRGRLSGVMRPGLRMALNALILALLTPIINLNWSPVPFGLIFVFGVWPVSITLAFLAVWLAWVGTLALLRAGLRDRLVEWLAVPLFWGAAYAFVMLWQGVGTLDMR